MTADVTARCAQLDRPRAADHERSRHRRPPPPFEGRGADALHALTGDTHARNVETHAPGAVLRRRHRLARRRGRRADLAQQAGQLHRAVPAGRHDRRAGPRRRPGTRARASASRSSSTTSPAPAPRSAPPTSPRPSPTATRLLMGAVHHTIATSVYKKLPYDFGKDFAPITTVALVPNVLVVNASVPAKNVQELVALREGAIRQAGLRVERHGHVAAPDRRAVQNASGRRHPARAVQGQRSARERPAGRPGGDVVRHHHAGAAAHQGRQAAGAWR